MSTLSAQPVAESTWSRTFAAMRVRNFRLYILSQTISQAGTWMQAIAQGWLVLELTGSGAAVGGLLAMQSLPVLFFAPVGGLVVDRVNKQHLLIVTQALSGVLAAVLWLLTVTDRVELWMVYGLALGLGFVFVFDNPVRQSMSIELVGPDLLTNAVTLNNVNFNVSRIVGPSLAGIVIRQIGIGPCFLANAVTYIAVIIALLLLRNDELYIQPRQPRAKRQLREGLQYVWRTPHLRMTVLMMFFIGTFTYETAVTLPILAKGTFHGDSGTYSLFTGAMGLGAVLVGLGYASRMRVTMRSFIVLTFMLGVLMVAATLAPTQPIEVITLVALGGASVSFLAAANTTLQLTTPPEMRGRVLSLWSMAFMGTAPIGGPLVGWIADLSNPRWAMFAGAAAPLIAAAIAWPVLANQTAALTPAAATTAASARS